MTYSQNLNQGDGNLEEYTKLIMVISQQMQELQALSMSIPAVEEKELGARFSLILEKLDSFIGTSAVAKSSMEVIFAKFLSLHGNGL